MQWRNRHHDTPVLRELVALAAIRTVAREVWGQELVLWRTQLFGLSQIDWHCDCYPDEADPPETLTLHLALSDYDESVGAAIGLWSKFSAHTWSVSNVRRPTT